MQQELFEPFATSIYRRPKDNLARLPKCGSRREAVLRKIIKSGRTGLTDHELAEMLALTFVDLQKKRFELLVGGLIQDAIIRRKNPEGTEGIVWRSTSTAEKMWAEGGRR